MDLTLLRLAGLIVHDLPQITAGGRIEGTVSNAESTFTNRIRNFFQERVRDALTRRGLEIGFDPNTHSPVPGAIRQILSDPSTFVASSQTIANHLFSLQTGVYSAGLLCVARGRLSQQETLAIIKLEHESGVRAHREDRQGQLRFEIELIDDLMLTDNTRVFKVALFVLEGSDVVGMICDAQRSRTQLVADYYLRKFLGCELIDRADLLTKRFLSKTEEFLDENLTDPKQRAHAQVGLLAEITSNADTFSPRRFAQQHLPTNLRDKYLQVAQADGIRPGNIPKDVALIKSRIDRVHITMDGDISILAPPAAIERVQISKMPNERSKIEITGRIEKIDGHR